MLVIFLRQRVSTERRCEEFLAEPKRLVEEIASYACTAGLYLVCKLAGAAVNAIDNMADC